MTDKVTIEFEFDVGDFVAHKHPALEDAGDAWERPRGTPGMQVVSRRWVDGRVLYDVRGPAGTVEEYLAIELESWEAAAVRQKLTMEKAARMVMKVPAGQIIKLAESDGAGYAKP